METERKRPSEDARSLSFFTRVGKTAAGRILIAILTVAGVCAYPAMQIVVNVIGIVTALIAGLGLLLVDAIVYPTGKNSGMSKRHDT